MVNEENLVVQENRESQASWVLLAQKDPRGPKENKEKGDHLASQERTEYRVHLGRLVLREMRGRWVPRDHQDQEDQLEMTVPKDIWVK